MLINFTILQGRSSRDRFFVALVPNFLYPSRFWSQTIMVSVSQLKTDLGVIFVSKIKYIRICLIFHSLIRHFAHIVTSFYPRDTFCSAYLFVICGFDSMFKQFSQLCLLLQDGWIHAGSVVNLRVRSQTNKENLSDYSLPGNLAAATQKDEVRFN